MSLNEDTQKIPQIQEEEEIKEEIKEKQQVEQQQQQIQEQIIKKENKTRRVSVKDVANLYLPQYETMEDIKQKPYFRLLLKEEKVIYDGIVWKRSGWSFKNRYLILTNKPRIFYTTPQGHFKGLIPWSMTEPIQITKVDATHFNISVHTSSRVYYFNDQIQGSDKWVEIITELCGCWKMYLETRSLK